MKEKHVVLWPNGHVTIFKSAASYARFCTRKFPHYTRWIYVRHSIIQGPGLEQYMADEHGMMRIEKHIFFPNT